MITYLDPIGEPTTNVLEYDLRVDLSQAPLRIGVISNAFPDSDRFRDIIGRQIAGRYPGVDIRRWEKKATDPYTEEHLAEIKTYDAAALLWGH